MFSKYDAMDQEDVVNASKNYAAELKRNKTSRPDIDTTIAVAKLIQGIPMTAKFKGGVLVVFKVFVDGEGNDPALYEDRGNGWEIACEEVNHLLEYEWIN